MIRTLVDPFDRPHVSPEAEAKRGSPLLEGYGIHTSRGQRRSPLLEGEGQGEVCELSGKVTHLTLSLSFQERGPALPARCVNAVAFQERGPEHPARGVETKAFWEGEPVVPGADHRSHEKQGGSPGARALDPFTERIRAGLHSPNRRDRPEAILPSAPRSRRRARNRVAASP